MTCFVSLHEEGQELKQKLTLYNKLPLEVNYSIKFWFIKK